MPSAKTEKKSKRHVKSDSEEEVPEREPVRSDDEQEDKFETNEPTHEQDSEKKQKSIIDFEADEVHKYEGKTLREASIIEILKVLIVRGKTEHNPALWRGSERLLQQLNGERQRHQPRRNQPFRGNGQIQGNQGVGQFQVQGNGYRPRAPFYQQGTQQPMQPRDEPPRFGIRNGFRNRENIR